MVATFQDSLQKVRLSNCGSCIAGSTDCRCTATCLPEHILMPGSEVKEGLKRCLAVDATSGAMPCEEITSGKNCARNAQHRTTLAPIRFGCRRSRFEVCDVCTPKRYPGQEACQCSVKCAEGFRPVGGPPEGPRSCDPNDKHGGGASISGGAFLSPPACIKKLDPPRCSRPEMPGMKVTGCNCQVGQENCPCHFDCEDGYRVTQGKLEPQNDVVSAAG
eukprot:g20931.t1